MRDQGLQAVTGSLPFLYRHSLSRSSRKRKGSGNSYKPRIE